VPSTTAVFGPITLEPVLGPPLEPITLGPGKPYHVGRLPECEIRLPEEEKTVSRRHCRIEQTAGGWQLTDLGSRHGTAINDQVLQPNQSVILGISDLVRIGPWVLRVQDHLTRALGTMTTDDTRSGARLVPVSIGSRQSIDKRRLEQLISVSKRIQTANDEAALAEGVLDALLDGTGYPRAAILRAENRAEFERVDVLGQRAAPHSRAMFQFSRSLIRAACAGRPVQLRSDDLPLPPMSILTNGSVTAMAVPVLLDGRAVLCIYLDARQDETPPHDDAAAFCQTIAEMCGLSLASMQRQRAEAERLRLTEQMDAAMQVQRQILPPPEGELPGIRYAMELRPGRHVAGDLFDIMPLGDGHVAFFIGDVSGKGLPAAILAATTQAFLASALLQSNDPARALNAVNKYLARHAPENKFVSLWLGVIDTRTGLLNYVDAGHSYWLLRVPGSIAPASVAERPDGPPLRVDEDFVYSGGSCTLAPGSRIILYSDGVAEQVPPGCTADEGFGFERTIATLASGTTAMTEVHALVRAVQAYAQSEVLGDDLTVASVEYLGPPQA
jgi:serine phosphatase RsbU (regulator of sigma subunit)/pSer/pThr/pTyr-binding forkhead associated (FHA) protein